MGRRLPDHDARKRRTRDALQSAFLVLALQRRYHAIRIDDILQSSGVGRSTFYEHYAGKDALLVASMDDALALLAGLPAGACDPRRVAMLLDHFWRNRVLARSLFQGTALRVVRNALVTRVEAGLRLRGGVRLRVPHRLAAHELADAMLSPIVAWLAGEAACGADDLAAALGLASQATLAGFTAA